MRYAVVLDAGSTGSRVHSYRFRSSAKGVLTLVDDTFEQLKPGLSSFAEVLPPAQDMSLFLPALSHTTGCIWRGHDALRPNDDVAPSGKIPSQPDSSLAQPSITLSSSASGPLSGVNTV
jgi:hypothetical protein